MSKININSNQIKLDTGKALLVSIPNSNDSFWIPSKLAYRRGWYTTLYIPDDMKMSCIHGKSERYELSVDKLTERLTDVLENCPRKQKSVIHHVPEEKEAIEVDIDDDLKR